MEKRTNDDLKAVYQEIYLGGREKFFGRFATGKDDSATDTKVVASLDWAGKTVLDVGCGVGDTAAAIASAGARHVTGIDYAAVAIEKARALHVLPNLTFEAMSVADWRQPVDVVVSCGTLEHMDKPQDVLSSMLALVGPGGHVIVTCPYFINIRGFIWMALATLFEVPMSLTDRHFIAPFDVERWLEGTTHRMDVVQPYDADPANGRAMLVDMEKRLTNALRDARMQNDRVPLLIDWLRDVVDYHERTAPPGLGGRNALYKIVPRA